MGRACAYSILAVLFIAVHFSMAFPSNIHEKMTRAERFTVFGSEDSIPEYEVFSASLPGARRRRKADDNIKLKLKINGKRIVLDLKPVTTYLATKNTPVWTVEYNEDTYDTNSDGNIRYVPLPRAMSTIGEFKMYHDVENEAAVTVYKDRHEGSVMEGIVGAYYTIKSLPKRLMRQLLAEGSHLVRTQKSRKRSIISDTEKDEGYYVVFKTPTASKGVKSSTLVDPDNLQREKRASSKAGKQKILKAVYPEMLIIVDHSVISSCYYNLRQVLRFTLAFWNGVDLIYRALDKPKVYLNIAGIIIAGDKFATPYIVTAFSLFCFLIEEASFCFFPEDTMLKVPSYFDEEMVPFPMKRYDTIIAMTTYRLTTYGHTTAHGVGFNDPYSHVCSSQRIDNTRIASYWWKYTGVRAAAQVTAHLLGVKDDPINGTAPDCASKKGYIMAEAEDVHEQKLQWSSCSRRDFSRFFSSEQSACLQNKPLLTKQVGEMLPGRWTTLDEQCQIEGYAKACKLKKFSRCAAKGCQHKKSGKCVRTKEPPLPGSECGTDMHCSTKKTCVSD